MKKIQTFFEEGLIQKEILFHEDMMDFILLKFYFPKILIGTYKNEFEENYFKIGVSAESTIEFNRCLDNVYDNSHIVFDFKILGFGVGIFRQKGY